LLQPLSDSEAFSESEVEEGVEAASERRGSGAGAGSDGRRAAPGGGCSGRGGRGAAQGSGGRGRQHRAVSEGGEEEENEEVVPVAPRSEGRVPRQPAAARASRGR
jgi:hypothetical protein